MILITMAGKVPGSTKPDTVSLNMLWNIEGNQFLNGQLKPLSQSLVQKNLFL